MLVAVGRRFRAGPLMIDRMFSMILEGTAAELAGDEEARREIGAADAAMSEWRHRVQAARERLGTWPLVSVVLEETAEGEMAYLERLVE